MRCTLVYLGAVLMLPLLGGCGRFVLTADDVVCIPGQDVLFVAQLDRETIWGLRKAVEDCPVVFALDEQPIGTARTDEEGRARLASQVADIPETARVRVTVPSHPELAAATGRVRHWSADRVIIAVDIDHTISNTDLDELLFEPRDIASAPLPNSVATLHELAKHFELMYVTARPRFLLEKTRDWLAQHHYPDRRS